MGSPSFDDATLDDGGLVLVVTGELDLTNVGDLRRRIDSAIDRGDTCVVVDLSGVTHMDSSGLAELLSAHQRARAAGGGVALVVTSPGILRTLEIRGVDGLFAIAATRAEARAALP